MRIHDPVIRLALTISEASRAIGCTDGQVIRDAILNGDLVARTVGGKHRRMILIGGAGGLQHWLERQPIAPSRKTKRSPNV
jgi:hypothetical protein